MSNTDKKDNSIKKDVLVAGGGIVGFYIILVIATWLDSLFNIPAVFTLVDVASTGLQIVTASAFAWILKRIIFTNTLGKDFGGVFNEGWAQFTIKEKAQWIIISFLALFIGCVIASAS